MRFRINQRVYKTKMYLQVDAFWVFEEAKSFFRNLQQNMPDDVDYIEFWNAGLILAGHHKNKKQNKIIDLLDVINPPSFWHTKPAKIKYACPVTTNYRKPVDTEPTLAENILGCNAFFARLKRGEHLTDDFLKNVNDPPEKTMRRVKIHLTGPYAPGDKHFDDCLLEYFKTGEAVSVADNHYGLNRRTYMPHVVTRIDYLD